jgi:hypothetical protein
MVERRSVRCDCRNPRVRTRPVYSFGKWFLLIFGATPKPDGREIYCENCGEILASTDTE